MPKTPINYSNCVMYRIVCNDINITDCYVGHSTNLTKRRYKHRRDSLTKDIKVYKFIRDHGGFDNWSVIEIEKYPCADYDEAVMRERHWIESYKATLNTANIPERICCANCNKVFPLHWHCPYCNLKVESSNLPPNSRESPE